VGIDIRIDRAPAAQHQVGPSKGRKLSKGLTQITQKEGKPQITKRRINVMRCAQ
jgi:hypothetical protein